MAEFVFPSSPGDKTPLEASNGIEYQYVAAENKWIVKSSNVTSTSTPAVIDRTAVPTAITPTIDLRGELPSRFEMRMMIKAKY